MNFKDTAAQSSHSYNVGLIALEFPHISLAYSGDIALESRYRYRRAVLRSGFCRHFDFLDNGIDTVVDDDLYRKVAKSLGINVECNEVSGLACYRSGLVDHPSVLCEDIEIKCDVTYRNISVPLLVHDEPELRTVRGDYLSIELVIVDGKGRAELDRDLDIFKTRYRLDLRKLLGKDIEKSVRDVVAGLESGLLRIAIIGEDSVHARVERDFDSVCVRIGLSEEETGRRRLVDFHYEVIYFGKSFVSFSRRHIMLLPKADGDFTLYPRGIIQERSAQARRKP